MDYLKEVEWALSATTPVWSGSARTQDYCVKVGSRYVVSTDGSGVVSSTDLVTWTEELPTAEDNGRFIMIGSGETQTLYYFYSYYTGGSPRFGGYYSTDGATWTWLCTAYAPASAVRWYQADPNTGSPAGLWKVGDYIYILLYYQVSGTYSYFLIKVKTDGVGGYTAIAKVTDSTYHLCSLGTYTSDAYRCVISDGSANAKIMEVETDGGLLTSALLTIPDAYYIDRNDVVFHTGGRTRGGYLVMEKDATLSPTFIEIAASADDPVPIKVQTLGLRYCRGANPAHHTFDLSYAGLPFYPAFGYDGSTYYLGVVMTKTGLFLPQKTCGTPILIFVDKAVVDVGGTKYLYTCSRTVPTYTGSLSEGGIETRHTTLPANLFPGRALLLVRTDSTDPRETTLLGVGILQNIAAQPGGSVTLTWQTLQSLARSDRGTVIDYSGRSQDLGAWAAEGLNLARFTYPISYSALGSSTANPFRELTIGDICESVRRETGCGIEVNPDGGISLLSEGFTDSGWTFTVGSGAAIEAEAQDLREIAAVRVRGSGSAVGEAGQVTGLVRYYQYPALYSNSACATKAASLLAALAGETSIRTCDLTIFTADYLGNSVQEWLLPIIGQSCTFDPSAASATAYCLVGEESSGTWYITSASIPIPAGPMRVSIADGFVLSGRRIQAAATPKSQESLATTIGQVELDYTGTSANRDDGKYWVISTTTLNIKRGDFIITESSSSYEWQVPVEGLYAVSGYVSTNARTALFEIWADLVYGCTISSGEATAKSYAKIGTHFKRHISQGVPYYPMTDFFYILWLFPSRKYAVTAYHTDGTYNKDFTGRVNVILLREYVRSG